MGGPHSPGICELDRTSENSESVRMLLGLNDKEALNISSQACLPAAVLLPFSGSVYRCNFPLVFTGHLFFYVIEKSNFSYSQCVCVCV